MQTLCCHVINRQLLISLAFLAKRAGWPPLTDFALPSATGASENGYARDLAERALAHTIQNQAEAAYHRTDLLEQRRASSGAYAEVFDPHESRGQPIRCCCLFEVAKSLFLLRRLRTRCVHRCELSHTFAGSASSLSRSCSDALFSVPIYRAAALVEIAERGSTGCKRPLFKPIKRSELSRCQCRDGLAER